MKNPRDIIRFAQLTEKSTVLSANQNKYFFEVARDANKPDIKKAIEKLFKVTVLKVNTANYEGKARASKQRGGGMGRQSSWKRAVVTVKKDQKIEFV